MYSFEKLKVCFVGLGSIASKHINNLRVVCKEESVELIIHVLRRASSTADNDSPAVIEALSKVDKVMTSFEKIDDFYDAIFITNPTEYHIDTLEKVHNKTNNFFIEKPIISVARIEEAENFVVDSGKNYYVACPLRYTDVLLDIKERLSNLSVNCVRSISSSYLPDWRPGTDYRNCYSAKKALGGGVSIDLIHEWDYITWMFGFPTKVNSIITRKSNLEIDSDDVAVYIADYSDMVVELHLDYFGRKTIREVMIFDEDDTIVGDLVANKVTSLKVGTVTEGSADGKVVGQRELRHFLDIIDGKIENDNDIEHSIKTLKLAAGLLG